MPSGDRTGPMGQGPRTGRARGYCSGFDAPGYEDGFSHNRGWGAGRNLPARLGRRGTAGRGTGFGRRAGTGYAAGIDQGYGADRLYNFGLLLSELIQHVPWQDILHKRDEMEELKTEAQRLKRSNEELEEKLRKLEEHRE
ncbi:MAG: DUF5320 family protein [Proteiniphilum sp.]|nr:DUF5320 family protein [Proteiniphilum sp.]MDD4801202.1 DUF5320 family protein [Proteiniphilum sp.]